MRHTITHTPGVSINFPGLLFKAPNLSGNTFSSFSQIFIINFKILKRKLKQEGDLFELFSITKRKAEQWNWYILLMSIVLGQKSTNQCIVQYMVENWHGFLHVVYRWSEWLLVDTAKKILTRCPSLMFWDFEETSWQKVEIAPLVDVQPSVNTRGIKLLLLICGCLIFKHFEM